MPILRYDNLEQDCELDLPWPETIECCDCHEDHDYANIERCEECGEAICDACWTGHSERCQGTL